MSFIDQVKKGWNAFLNRTPEEDTFSTGGPSYYNEGHNRTRTFRRIADRSLVQAPLTRMATDAAQLDIKHVKVNNQDQMVEIIEDSLNNCLTVEANIDQHFRDFFQDIYASVMDEGVIAVCPVEASHNPTRTEQFKIYTLRTGRITAWYPRHVRVELYNDRTGEKKELIYPKRSVAIIYNPYYEVMNTPSSTYQRILRTLDALDVVGEQNKRGKLDIIVSLPYVVKGEVRKKQAKERMEEIENQLNNSTYGIAWTDGTEKITQLNRSITNNLMEQATNLIDLFYTQLGITKEIMNGTADEKVMSNYYSRTIQPLVDAVTLEFKRKFLSKNARTRKETIMYFRDQFKLLGVSDIAQAADLLARNAILTSNEIRARLGLEPSSDPIADELRNKNISQAMDNPNGEPQEGPPGGEEGYDDYGEYENYDEPES